MQANRFTISAARESLSQDIFGTISAPPLPKEQSFFGTDELIAIMHEHMNEHKMPKSATAERSFGKSGEVGLDKAKRENAQEIAPQEKNTFVVTVLYRQNATWQGTMKWVESGKETKFRSALELIRLMDGAIGAEEQA